MLISEAHQPSGASIRLFKIYVQSPTKQTPRFLQSKLYHKGTQNQPSDYKYYFAYHM